MISLNKRTVTVSALLCLAAIAARAQTLYSTGFEPPTYTAGSSASGVDGWVNGSGSGGSFTVSATRPETGTQSLFSDNSSTFNSFYSMYHGLGGYTSQGPLFASVSLWISSTTEANRMYGMYLGSTATSTLGGTVLGLTIDGSGNIRAGVGWSNTYSNTGLFATAPAGSFFDRWLTLTLGFNPATGEKTVSISGFAGGLSYSNTYTGGAAPANLNLGTDYFTTTARAGTAYFDNLSVRVVPEPTTMALLGLASVGFAVRAVRRRR